MSTHFNIYVFFKDKRYLAFIANDGDSSKSTCLVFLSDKMSETITRTIGEAFDLCYKVTNYFYLAL